MHKNNKFKLNIALDVDDVLFPCNDYAISLINKEYCMVPPMKLEEITSWEKRNNYTDLIFKYFSRKDFWEKQPVYPGAKEFVSELSKYANIFITSAVYPEYMSIRALKIIETFPEIPKENIILGARKDMYNFDITLDDGGHNITESRADYPILFRKPWNSNLTGLLSVNNYDEALNMIKNIISEIPVTNNPDVIALIAPTGSGKNEIMREILKNSLFKRPLSYTTCPDASNEYKYITYNEFIEKKNSGFFFESTVYAGYYYAIEKSSIEEIINNGKKCIIPVDICGAMAIKNHFTNTSLCYIKRSKEKLIENILIRDIPNKEKIKRILSIDDEKKNYELCDCYIDFKDDVDNAINEFYNQYNVK